MTPWLDDGDVRLCITKEQRRALGSLEDFLADDDWRLPHITAIRRAWDTAERPREAAFADATNQERPLRYGGGHIDPEDCWPDGKRPPL